MTALTKSNGLKAAGGIALALATGTSSAWAHTVAGGTGSWIHGLAHPLIGWDHLLIAFTVGLWASQQRSPSRWWFPITFLAAMVVGSTLAVAGLALPAVPTGIAVASIALALCVAVAARFPLAGSLSLIGAVALLHGHAHGYEMGSTLAAPTYLTGLIAATGLLHVTGIATGRMAFRFRRAHWLQWTGSAVAVLTLMLWVG